MARGALGGRLSCLLELNVIYTAERRRIEARQSRGGLNREEKSAGVCVCEQE